MTNPNTIPNPNPNLNPTPEYTPNTLQLLGWSPGSGAHVQPGGGFGGGHVQPFGLQGFDWNARDACKKKGCSLDTNAAVARWRSAACLQGRESRRRHST